MTTEEINHQLIKYLKVRLELHLNLNLLNLSISGTINKLLYVFGIILSGRKEKRNNGDSKHIRSKSI